MRIDIATAGRVYRPGDVEGQCSFCLRDRAELRMLVTAPPRVSICAECVDACARELRRRRIAPFRWIFDPRRPVTEPDEASGAPYRSAGAAPCTFCQQERPGETLVAERARICATCVRLALDVVVEEAERSRRRA
jgi:ClpX C4-type zinc finger